MKKLLLNLCILTLPGPLLAGAIPWYGTNGGSSQFTVPAGKILLVEQWVSEQESGGSTVTVYQPNLSGFGAAAGPIKFFVPTSDYAFRPRLPIRIAAGGFITWTGTVTPMGLVVDAADLYAQADPVIRSMTADGSMVSAIVDARTTRPTRTIPEVSTNLENWDLTGVSVAYSRSNPRFSKIVAPQNAMNKFLRADVVLKTAAVGSDDADGG